MQAATIAPCQIDHLVVTARSLEAGADFVTRSLGVGGVGLQPGGEHERMGTHNRVLRLGAATYLEVIAPNPAAPRPPRPRWFELDDPAPAPRLATWVARTTGLRDAALPEALGRVEPMSRSTLRWLITIPADGRLPLGGVAPALIEWQVPTHPASAMRDVGCALLGLELFSPQPDALAALLGALGLEQAVRVLPASEHPFLVAHIRTPQGVRTLGGARGSLPGAAG